MRTVEDEVFESGSDNAFADLGLADPEERLLKAKLMLAINTEIENRQLTQEEAAERVGLAQSDLSRIANGRGSGYSAERLIHVLRNLGLGRDVEIGLSVASGPVGELR